MGWQDFRVRRSLGPAPVEPAEFYINVNTGRIETRLVQRPATDDPEVAAYLNKVKLLAEEKAEQNTAEALAPEAKKRRGSGPK